MDSINIVEKENSKNLLVIFSARNSAKGKFTFSGKFKSLPATKVYINDYNNEWYTNGVPDYPSDDALVDFLNECKSKYIKNGKLWIVGSSMGAYAALKFGALVGADRIIAFNPENKLGMKFSKSIENSNLISDEHNNFDLCSLKYNENSEIIIVSNNGNFVDYYSANKFKHAIPNSKVYVLNNFKHNILEELNQTKNVDDLLGLMISKGSSAGLSDLKKCTLFKDDEIEELKTLNEQLLLENKDVQVNIHLVEKMIQKCPDSGYFNFLYGLSLDVLGFKSSSVSYLNKALEYAPFLGRATIKLGQVYNELKEYDKAIFLLEPFCRKNFNIKALITLCSAYEKLGLFQSSLSALDYNILNNKAKAGKVTVERRRKMLLSKHPSLLSYTS
ncbi:hypothetical protein VC596_24200 [Citrobacter freundii]|uniref:tetratricopeptide repeat protein n=1 Tax=Enterobacteriaceae TaxID=543 RepID=UPI000B5A3BCF|nr:MULTISPECIES: hypothetical protein [Enterobacteriaceae]EFH7310585.1 hypothetical protein [Escherichia coli]HEE9994332.1 hypothetical protein [Citrobacter braakii]ASK02194.1 hypothetical protein CFA70_19955 [Citrobacter freundii]MCY3452207.1 hypothetical protein [Citrobacter freundii]MDF3830700.1 hypothetical protein [Pseudocitrobacter sp. 2023EL-00150]